MYAASIALVLVLAHVAGLAQAPAPAVDVMVTDETIAALTDAEIERHAGEWFVLPTGEGGNVMELEYAGYLRQLRDRSPEPQLWMRINRSRDRRVQWRFEINLIRFLCRSRELRWLSTTRYLPDGSIHSSQRYSGYDNSLEHAVPNSYGDIAMRYACPSA